MRPLPGSAAGAAQLGESRFGVGHAGIQTPSLMADGHGRVVAYHRRDVARPKPLRQIVALDLDRVMAWHILTSLGDALWRAEAGVAMPAGGATPDDWFDLVENRLDRLGLDVT